MFSLFLKDLHIFECNFRGCLIIKKNICLLNNKTLEGSDGISIMVLHCLHIFTKICNFMIAEKYKKKMRIYCKLLV